MGVRTYLRSPAALAWTALAAVGVWATVVAGWQLAFTLASGTAIAESAFLGGLGAVVLVGVVAGATLSVAAAVWLPCSAAIAYAVGRRVRGDSAGFARTVRVVRARSEPLYRWAKTTVAVGGIADRILTTEDTAPREVAAGCGGFVVPALVLDAATLSSAVDRANRVVPTPGRRRIQAIGAAGTTLLVVGAGGVGVVAGRVPSLPAEVAVPGPMPAVAVALLVGVVVTAAVDTAWRASAYASADLHEGFSR